MIEKSKRTEGMVDASADYYQESRVFEAIQNAQALEYDRIEKNNNDLALQLSPYTATWGLIYWEESVGLLPQRNTDYEARRPAVLERLLPNYQNFSAEMLQAVVATYGKRSTVSAVISECLMNVYIQDGFPKYLQQLVARLEKITHAHLGLNVISEENSAANIGISSPVVQDKGLAVIPLKAETAVEVKATVNHVIAGVVVQNKGFEAIPIKQVSTTTKTRLQPSKCVLVVRDTTVISRI